MMTCSVDITYLMIASFLNSFFFCIVDIVVGVCIIHCPGDVVRNVSWTYGFEGLGGMAGPFLLGLIGKMALKILTLMLLCSGMLLLFDLFWKISNKKEEENDKDKDKK